MDRIAPTDKHAYLHNGQKIYEWNQTLSDVNIYIELPPGTRAKHLAVSIHAAKISVGLQGNPPYLDKELAKQIKVSDSLWTVEDGVLVLQLAKLVAGEPWDAAIAGHQVGGTDVAEDQRRLMLERFQAEHPGFDFSQAQFNGEVPNPATFLKDIQQ